MKEGTCNSQLKTSTFDIPCSTFRGSKSWSFESICVCKPKFRLRESTPDRLNTEVTRASGENKSDDSVVLHGNGTDPVWNESRLVS